MSEQPPSVAKPTQKPSTVRQIIERTWAEMMPFAQLDESVAWRDAGVDSLLTLQFVVRLEQQLKTPLTFDMFTLDMTVGEIISAIENSQSATKAKAPVKTELDVTLFLVPGLFGDEPMLAEFRRSLAGKLRIETLALPDLEEPASVTGSMTRAAEFLVRQITERQPNGPLHLAGYSIGGMAAFEAANQLIAAGREVKFLGLLDCLYGGNMKSGAAYSGAMEGVREHGETAEYGNFLTLFQRRAKEDFTSYRERLIYGTLMRLGLMEQARRWIRKHWDKHSLEANIGRRRRLIQMLRGRSVFFWRPRPCPAPTLLVVSDSFETYFKPDAWRPLCPNLTMVRVPGHHFDLFKPASLAKLNPALIAALGETAPPQAKAA